MSANETYELAVQLRGEGVEETQSDIQGVGDEFEQTTDTVDDTAGEMEGLSERWRGAMTAIVGGLAVASAGLLTQVPILSELMGGLNEIISAVAFQMDQVLRPVLEPLTGFFFDIAGGIFELEGAAGDVVGILGSLIVLAAGLATALAGLSAIGIGPGVAGGFAILAAGAKAAAVAIAGVISSISLAAAAIVALVAAIALLAIAFIVDFKGIRSGTVSILGDIINALVEFGQDVVGFFLGLAAQATQWGIDLIQEFIAGLKSAIPDVKGLLSGFMDSVTGIIGFDIAENDRMARRWGSDLVSEFAVGFDQQASVSMPEISASDDGGPSRPASGGGKTTVVLDGRRVDKGVRPHRADETAPRGRHS
jgi:hypothetical protein